MPAPRAARAARAQLSERPRALPYLVRAAERRILESADLTPNPFPRGKGNKIFLLALWGELPHRLTSVLAGARAIRQSITDERERSRREYGRGRQAQTVAGVEPERFDAGTVEDDAGRHRQITAAGWYFPGKRREVVVIIPAAGGSEDQLIPYVKFLHEAGYTVVASYSANNPSFGINWGMLKRKFALATARTLLQDGFEKIAVLGISEGAAGAIMAQAEQPVFMAIVADSSYANLAQLLRRSPSISRLNPAFASTVLWEAQWVFGRPLSKVSPVNDAANLGNCSLLVIQNRGDKITPLVDGKAILYAAGLNSEIWIAPSDGHGDAIYEAPAIYAEHVIKFLNTSFGIRTPAASTTPRKH